MVIAGRLDKDSEGLILLTNDGALVNKLTHPRYGHTKEYLVTTVKPLDNDALSALGRGIKLTEGTGRFDKLTAVGDSTYRVILHQGWKRQIRRMIGKVKNDVERLTRVKLGQLELGDLEPGKWREVQRSDIL